MLQKRKALAWTVDAPPIAELAGARKVLETGAEPMDLEFDAAETPASCVVVFEDEDEFLEKVRNCKFLRDSLYNDGRLLDRELTNQLLSAVLYCSQ